VFVSQGWPAALASCWLCPALPCFAGVSAIMLCHSTALMSTTLPCSHCPATHCVAAVLHLPKSELRDGYASLVDGAVTRRKIDSTDPTSKTYW
jgi:hypothetical protein